MYNIKDIFSEAAKYALKEKKIKQKRIAPLLGMSVSSLNDYVNSRREGDENTRTKIAKMLGYDYFAFMSLGRYILENGDAKGWKSTEREPVNTDIIDYTPPNSSGRMSKITYIPVVGKIPAGIPDTNEWDVEYNIQVPNMPEHCYAMKVVGDSMEPRIMEGEHVIFTIDFEIESGDVVIVTDEYGDSMVKRYKVKDGKKYFVSDNSKYKPISPNGDFGIVGKVINSVLIKKH